MDRKQIISSNIRSIGYDSQSLIKEFYLLEEGNSMQKGPQ